MKAVVGLQANRLVLFQPADELNKLSVRIKPNKMNELNESSIEFPVNTPKKNKKLTEN